MAKCIECEKLRVELEAATRTLQRVRMLKQRYFDNWELVSDKAEDLEAELERCQQLMRKED